MIHYLRAFFSVAACLRFLWMAFFGDPGKRAIRPVSLITRCIFKETVTLGTKLIRDYHCI